MRMASQPIFESDGILAAVRDRGFALGQKRPTSQPSDHAVFDTMEGLKKLVLPDRIELSTSPLPINGTIDYHYKSICY